MKTPQGKKIEIIKSIAPQWKDLGTLLEFDDDGHTLELIETQHGNPLACCRRMFRHWIAGNGKPATWETLLELLDDIGEKRLVEQIKLARALSPSQSHSHTTRVHVQAEVYAI